MKAPVKQSGMAGGTWSAYPGKSSGWGRKMAFIICPHVTDLVRMKSPSQKQTNTTWS
jgi:hypothetical protein